MSYFDIHNIIRKEHHGSLKHHSTNTALAEIYHHLMSNYHNDKISAVIQTDLSSAYDTVDHNILFKKLEYYSIQGSENNLLRSILEDRYQYVEIDGFVSEVIRASTCSVLQGSKLSSLLYIIYCNEIPLLYQITYSPI